MKKIFCLILFVLPAFANVCTPFNYPATGPFGAVVNGIDAIDWGVARIQWTSDASSGTPATQQRIRFATAAEWAVTPNAYPHQQGLQFATVTNSTMIQGAPLPNLLPATSYHVVGESFQGGSWCSSTDETFTTLAKPPNLDPVLPVQFVTAIPAFTAIPAMTGTHWTYLTNCGLSGSQTVRVQDCFTKANPGDDIGFPLGTYSIGQIYTQPNVAAVAVTCATGTNRCTQTGTPPASGSMVTFQAPPSPVNQGIPYHIVNVSGSTFQISYDGFTVIPFAAATTSTYYAPYPETGAKIVVHSTSAANVLPPAGVRTDLSYETNYPKFVLNDPSVTWLGYGTMSSNYVFLNIEISVDPAIAADSGTGVDPAPFNVPVAQNSINSNIWFVQDIFDFGAPPSRSKFFQLDGANILLYGNYQKSGLDFWQPNRVLGSATTTATTTTYPAGNVYYVGAGGSKVTCSYTGGTLTFTGGTTGTYTVYMDPVSCALSAQVQTGLTATGTNITVSTVASPYFPTYSFTGPSGNVFSGWNAITMGQGTISSGTNNYSDLFGLSLQNLESGIGYHIGSGPGPVMVVNNFLNGAGIIGVYASDDITDGNTPCGNVNPCPLNYNPGNITDARNTVTVLPGHFYDDVAWNGGDYSWRNMGEVKQGKWVLQDGNIYGPYSLQISQGECAGSHFTYSTGFNTNATYPNYADSSEWTFQYNTCYLTPSGGIYTGINYLPTYSPLPMKNAKIKGNVFYKNNAYAQFPTTSNIPLDSVIQRNGSFSNCPYGKLMQWNGQNMQFDHNTEYLQGGCLPWSWDQYINLSTGMSFTNNVFNLVLDPGTYSTQLVTGTRYQPNSTFGGTLDNPDCGATGGSVLLACLQLPSFSANLMLATYANSLPGSQTDYPQSQIPTTQALFPAGNYFPAQASTALRVANVGWYNSEAQDFHYVPGSVYASGGHLSLDGSPIGSDAEQLIVHQGTVQAVTATNLVTNGTNSGATFQWIAPDSFVCSVDYSTAGNPATGSTFTRIAGSVYLGRVQQASTGLTAPAGATLYYRVDCAVQQPTGSVRLP